MSGTVFISAGEPSGDAHAGALVAALRRARPDLAIEGFGGPKMEAAGAKLMARMEDYTVMGLVEVVKKVPAHWRLLKAIEKRLAWGDVDLLIVVDYPGFHLRLATVAHRLGVRVMYYIAPQLWAWHEERVKTLAAAVTRLAVILPFEEEFFRTRGVHTSFVGHPLLDRAGPLGDHRAHKTALGLDPDRPVLGLFPGSRGQETRRLWPVFRDAAALVRRTRPEVQCVVAAAGNSVYPDPGDIRVAADQAPLCFAAADAALCKSGTTTLEAALAGVPQVVAYKLNPASYFMARRLVRVPWIGLVNLVAGRQVAPELVQGAATAERLAETVLPLLSDGSPERSAQLEGAAEVRRKLGEPGAAVRAAELAAGLLVA